MSMSLAVEFQQNLYKALEKNAELKALISNIYQSLRSSPKYPYILQHVNNVRSMTSIAISNYEVEGEINIYVRDNTFSDFKNIIKLIEQIFKNFSEVLVANYNFISGNIIKAEFMPSEDMMTTRLKLSYIAIIQTRE